MVQPLKAKVRLIKLNKKMSQRKPRAKKPKRKRREGDTWDNKIDEANRKMVASLQLKPMKLYKRCLAFGI